MTPPLDAVLAAIVALIANAFVVIQIQKRAAPDVVEFLTRVYVRTLALRYGLALILNVLVTDSAFAAAFWGDSSAYDWGGYYLALAWSGEPVAGPPLNLSISGYGWVQFIGAIYLVVGRNQLLVQFINGLMGSLTVLVVYAITRRLFDPAAARWATLFMAFFPQMVFWSAGMYKDPGVLLCIALCMYAVLALRDHLSLKVVTLFVVAELVMVTLRFYVAYFVAFAAVAAFLFAGRRTAIRVIFTYSFLLVILVAALGVAVKRETLERQASYLTLERLQITREDQAMWGRSAFGQEYDVSTPSGAITALPVGLIYLLFAPFPWAISGIRQALTVPETLVWYALMPAFVRGLLYAAKRRLRAAMPILVFTVTLTCAYALMQGNVGTAYRQRTQVTMFFFIFMGVGLAQRRRERALRGALGPGAPRQV
jgi:4-amino-4-deoxy-L-arabinose transferase-like glycosyltransferase